MLKYLFEVVDMGDETIMVPVGEDASTLGGVLKLNREGKELFELLQSGFTTEQCIKTLTEKYDNDREDIKRYVTSFIETLKKNGILID